jgi:hypothetical protein
MTYIGAMNRAHVRRSKVLQGKCRSPDVRPTTGSRAPSWLWFLIALLTLHWAAPAGQQTQTSAPTRIAQGADGAPAHQRTGEPIVQSRLQAIARTAELRAHAGKQDPSIDDGPVVALIATELSLDPAASAAAYEISHRTDRATSTAHAYEARGPPRNI